MISDMIAFLAVLNPFALFIYLQPVMEELDSRKFLKVLLKASFISFVIYAVFAVVGNLIFEHIFHIHYEAFRIFGGLIVFTFAFMFIVKGQKALIHMKEDLDDLASEIALPFMVGGATISLAIVIGNKSTSFVAISAIAIIMAVNYIILVTMKYFRDKIEKSRFKVAFDKNLGIFLRLNAFFVGAIGINMIITGINNLYF